MPEFSRRTEALAAADAALQLAFAGASVGFWYFDCATRRAWHSASVRGMLGHAPEPAVVDIESQLHPDDFAIARAGGQELARGLTSELEVEFRMLHRDGQYRWMLNRGRVAERDASGQPTHLIGTVTDITARKQAEMARAARRAAHRGRIAPAHRLLEGLQRPAATAAATRPWRARCGSIRRQVIGRTDRELLLGWRHARQDRAHRRPDPRRAAELRNELLENWFDGERHAVLVNSVPLRDASGAIDGFVATVVDISDMDAAQAAIQRAEQRWGPGARQRRHLGLRARLRHRQRVSLGRAVRDAGHAPGELTSTDTTNADLAHPDDVARAERMVAGAPGATQSLHEELRFRCPDGGYNGCWCAAASRPRHADGRPQRFLGTHTDITPLKQAELAAESVASRCTPSSTRSCTASSGRTTAASTSAATPPSRPGPASARRSASSAAATTTWAGRRAGWLRCARSTRRCCKWRPLRSTSMIEVPAPDGVGHRLSTVLPFRHEASGFSGVIGVITDITELQRARQRAAGREGRRVALESLGAAVWEIDMEQGTVALVAHGRDARLRAQRAGAVARPALRPRVHPDDIPESPCCASWPRAARPTRSNPQYRLRCANGSYRWMLARGAVVDRDFSGRPRRLVGTHTDIDDEYEGRDRAAQARQLESLGRLAAGVAHEINTPLQFVSDSVSFLRSGMEDIAQLASSCGQCGLERASVDMPRALELVQQGIMRIAEIVRGMRVFAHPDSQAMEPVRVEDLLRSAGDRAPRVQAGRRDPHRVRRAAAAAAATRAS
ncbi:MAG: PAS domain-containing protein [Steroidobacteraceae bacterium]